MILFDIANKLILKLHIWDAQSIKVYHKLDKYRTNSIPIKLLLDLDDIDLDCQLNEFWTILRKLTLKLGICLASYCIMLLYGGL